MASSKSYQEPDKRSTQAGLPLQPPIPSATAGAPPVARAAQPAPVQQPAPLAGAAVPSVHQRAPAVTKGVTKPASTPDQAEGEAKTDLDPVAALVLDNSPPWLISMVFHMLVLIIMGMIVYVNMPRKTIQLNANTVYAEKKGDQLMFDAPGLPDVKTTADDVVIAPDNLPPVEAPLAAPRRVLDVQPEGTIAVSDTDIKAPQIGMALTGRQEGSPLKQGMLGKYGGGETTEAAVLKGLEWLARNQQRNGSWSLAGPFSGGVSRDFENEAAATAMALLAFQGAGSTHQNGKFKKNVANGWRWLLKQQDKSGCFFQNGGFNHRFYTQGQCSIAICELYGMSKDPKVKEPAQQAIDYCLRSQSPEGGWRYSPNADSDVSVTGWIVMALQSARMAGLEVPYENLNSVDRYLNSIAQHDGARYPYQRGADVRPSMTAEALLMREYLGWTRDDPRLVAGMEWITSRENLIDFKNNRNAYYWYYATQAARHIGGDHWKRWNAVMRQALPEQQVARGKEAGSWDPQKPTADQWANHGGRLYVTCLSIYMLEVYYRHMPIYSNVYSSDAPPTPVEKRAESEKSAANDTSK